MIHATARPAVRPEELIDALGADQHRLIESLSGLATRSGTDRFAAMIAVEQLNTTRRFFDAQRALMRSALETDAALQQIHATACDEATAVLRAAGLPAPVVLPPGPNAPTESIDDRLSEDLQELLERYWGHQRLRFRVALEEARHAGDRLVHDAKLRAAVAPSQEALPAGAGNMFEHEMVERLGALIGGHAADFDVLFDQLEAALNFDGEAASGGDHVVAPTPDAPTRQAAGLRIRDREEIEALERRNAEAFDRVWGVDRGEARSPRRSRHTIAQLVPVSLVFLIALTVLLAVIG